MDEERLNSWQTLFATALRIIDSTPVGDWTFGGGTVLMLRHHHRFSKDIDIFLSDAQPLAGLSPRLNDVTEELTTDYVESGGWLKLRFAEGEIDFIASAALTDQPFEIREILERRVCVETSTEIIAKKVWHRGDRFTGRDIFDLAMVAEHEPEALASIEPILGDRAVAILDRIDTHYDSLKAAFDDLDVLSFRRPFEVCVASVRALLRRST